MKEDPAVTREVFGAVIQAIRLATKRSQKDVALASGWSRSFTSLVEQGRRPSRVTWAHVEAVAVGLGMTVPDLMHKLLTYKGSSAVRVPQIVLRVVASDPDMPRLCQVMVDGGITARELLGQIPIRMVERVERLKAALGEDGPYVSR